jgi:hypothetical protein
MLASVAGSSLRQARRTVGSCRQARWVNEAGPRRSRLAAQAGSCRQARWVSEAGPRRSRLAALACSPRWQARRSGRLAARTGSLQAGSLQAGSGRLATAGRLRHRQSRAGRLTVQAGSPQSGSSPGSSRRQGQARRSGRLAARTGSLQAGSLQAGSLQAGSRRQARWVSVAGPRRSRLAALACSPRWQARRSGRLAARADSLYRQAPSRRSQALHQAHRAGRLATGRLAQSGSRRQVRYIGSLAALVSSLRQAAFAGSPRRHGTGSPRRQARRAGRHAQVGTRRQENCSNGGWIRGDGGGGTERSLAPKCNCVFWLSRWWSKAWDQYKG